MRKTLYLQCLMVLGIFMTSFAQQKTFNFIPGFNAQECDEMLKINSAFTDTIKGNKFLGFLNGYSFISRSKSVGLDNVVDFWLRADSTVIISLRGTTKDPKSLLSDFYCAMIPAKGKVILSSTDTIRYHLADDDRAAVHAGFLVSFAYLCKEISPKVDSLYHKGYHKYLVTGHSQGGSISIYVTAWLAYLKKQGTYPELVIKNYATAPAKMSNMYFAYDYQHITHSNQAFSLISNVDPVPEMPFTTQQLATDMNKPNPFITIYEHVGNLSFFKRIILKNAFKSMERKAEKSSKAYQKYLGKTVEKMVKTALPGLQLEPMANTTHFVTPGVMVALIADENYERHFKNEINKSLFHHSYEAYSFLLKQYATELNKAQ